MTQTNEETAQAMADALLECMTPDNIDDDATMIDELRNISREDELGWTCALIAENMDRARQLFHDAWYQMEAERDGIMEPDEYASERLGHTQMGLRR